LTPKALILLEYLMTHPDELISRERLLDVVWGWEAAVATRAVDARIAELRRALHDSRDQPLYIEAGPNPGHLREEVISMAEKPTQKPTTGTTAKKPRREKGKQRKQR
jgi:DNA-binding winged helix-turn-helix (wHTH) protein